MNEKMDELIDTRAMLDPETSRALRLHYNVPRHCAPHLR